MEHETIKSIFILLMLLIIPIGLLIYWKIRDYLKKKKIKYEELINNINDKEKAIINSINKVLNDHALRLRFINACLIYNKSDNVHYEQAAFNNEDLKTIGFSDNTIVKSEDRSSSDENRILSIKKLSDSNIKNRIDYESNNSK